VSAETLILEALGSSDEQPLAEAGDRRSDIEAKMGRVADLLRRTDCQGLLLLEPENLAWLTSGAAQRTVPDPSTTPGLYCNGDQRWLLCSNVDTQRLFDEELDSLGFQLKEWPWHWGREQILTDLCQGRKIAADRPLGQCVVIEADLLSERCRLSAYEQACMRALGALLAHAIEATCRQLALGQSEREIAGQLAHRLMHRGAVPLHIGVAADGRSRSYRQFSFTSTAVRRYAVITATARKYGLCATATRAVSFGTPDDSFRAETNAICRVAASFLASTWPNAVPGQVLQAARRIYQLSGYEHEWLAAPQGHLIGRRPIEAHIMPKTDELLSAGQAIVWIPAAGAASGADTYLVTNEGPRCLTPADGWPLKRIKIQGAEFVRPDVLVR
jgi:Xaa-Pro aminopeptidase